MWLITPIGFFSIVEKPEDRASGTLTVRARVRGDLEALQRKFLTALGPIQESSESDYRYRATAARADVAAAMTALVNDLTYSNLKREVSKRQSPARAHVYHLVWDVLYRLQAGKPTPK